MSDHRFAPPLRRNPPRQRGNDQCRWFACNEDRSRRYDDVFPFCQGHALMIWAIVQHDMDLEAERAELKARVVTPQNLAEHGWVYYLRIGDHIKIGYAASLTKRMAAYPPNTTFLAAHPGTRQDEKNLHAMLTLHRAAGREWYDQAPEVLATVEQAKARADRYRGDAFAGRTATRSTSMPGPQLRRRSGPQGWRV